MASRDEENKQWQVGKSLTQCNRYRLVHEIDCDVIFDTKSLSGPRETIRAHKYMLTTRSPVFEAMFSGGFKEEDVIEIEDVEPGIIRDMLM